MTDGDQIPALGDIVDFPDEQPEDGQRWIVLFDGDYQNHLVDADGKVGVRVDIDQASEILRLAADAVADLSYRDAEGDDVLRDLIDALEAEVGDE